MSVTIIGSGSLAGAIAALVGRAGTSLQILARDELRAEGIAPSTATTLGTIGDPIAGEVVVLAIPYGAVADVLGSYSPEAWAGRVVVDATNPVNFETFNDLVVPADSSAAAEIQQLLPRSAVVKAFNVNFAATLATGTIGDLPATLVVAGDDDAAKTKVMDLGRAAGLNAVDAGALVRARELEALGFLQISLAAAGKASWTGGFALIP